MKHTKRWLLLLCSLMMLILMGTTASAALTISKDKVRVPADYKVGSIYSVGGTLNSNIVLKQVTVGIYPEKGSTALYSYTAAPYSLSFNLAAADNAMLFDRLSVGKYYYRISVVDVNGTKLTVTNKEFNVLSGTSTMKITKKKVTVPTSLKQGASFTMSGTITATLPMKSIVFTIYNSTGKKCLQRYTATVNAKTYKVSKADKYMKFNKLAPGNYYYRISVYDMNGKKTRITSKKFTVVSGSTSPTNPTTQTSSIKIASPKPATSISMRQGTSYGIGGTITSSNKLASVKAELLKGSTVVYRKTVKPNTTTYTLAGSPLDAAMTFNELKPGVYTFVVSAVDSASKKAVLINRSIFITASASKVTIKSPAPSSDITINKGTPYGLGGLITSNQAISLIRGSIVNTAGNTVFQKEEQPNKFSYQLSGSPIDNALLFNQLSAGTYYLNVFVVDKLGSTYAVISRKVIVK